MERTCLKCGAWHDEATGSATEACPACGAIYAKVAAARRLIEEQRARRTAMAVSAPAPEANLPPDERPRAQATTPSRGNGALPWLIGAILVALVIAQMIEPNDRRGTGPVYSATPAATRAAPSIYTTTPAELAAGFERNEVRMKQVLAGHRVLFTERVESIDLTAFGDVALRFEVPGKFLSMSATLKAGQDAAASALDKGALVTLTCDSVSYIMGAPRASDCTVN